MNNEHRIVVLGGGYTGLFTAIRLARRVRRTGARITLVNPADRFVERLRTHQVAAGQDLPVHRIPDLLDGTGVTFVQATATAIDPDGRSVTLDDGTALGYDTLVYALGSRTDTSRVPGADAHAFTLDGARAVRFAARLRELGAGDTVTVCGGGLTGVEAATEIAESHPALRVTLISTSEPAAMMGPRARAHLNRVLDRLGVTVRTGARVARVLPDAVELPGGETVRSDACLWTTGVRAPALAGDAGIAVDERGMIVVDATLRSLSHPDVHAVGDAAAVRMPWGDLHGTCQSGMPTAQYTADTVARLLRGRPVKPFRFGYFHQPVSLGRRDAVIQFTRADDTPRRLYLKGRAAAHYKEAVSGSPITMYRLSKRVNVTATVSRSGRATDGTDAYRPPRHAGSMAR
ncbi:NAD(P)/FAD-dependent oxidoreductase [Actinomadura sp. WMMB 499]|uniref:NAD(P)/FAD-dependent oxidoreductase n=1 Tax=Actinomadura sp. WMMB 499 TaxID=1219491 RepID=UPI0012476289|nr:FAD-dependent oxidoreductase [Actinomadura sp. WMMB 499]QFG23069.1 FAD-dependent oxidoreductase [Actinomadura sp. WMMB 499]